jgi:type I restriction enzyme, S subunit
MIDGLKPYRALLRTPTMRTAFRVESKGLGTGSSGFMRLCSDRFDIIKIALPPWSEQEACDT